MGVFADTYEAYCTYVMNLGDSLEHRLYMLTNEECYNEWLEEQR